MFAAGPHYGDGTGGGERSKGQGHRRVCSCPSLLQGTCAEGTPQITSFAPTVNTFSYSRIGRECVFGVPLFSTFKDHFSLCGSLQSRRRK